jgi:NAD(P)-dependent dehydrogenase (short-subunit alcohol dehydrogenase family)
VNELTYGGWWTVTRSSGTTVDFDDETHFGEDLMELEGKVALVTGAGAGIGKESAILLSEHGARLVCMGRTMSKLDAVAREICDAGGDAIPVEADISSEADMTRAFREIEQRWGRLDVVFANAGINGTWAPIDELTVDEWDKTQEVNLRGTFLTLRSALPLLKVRGGAVTITSSVNGTRMFSNSGASAYSASKAGQVAFAKMAALELARYKIRVNVICPGSITTEINEKTVTRHRARRVPRREDPAHPRGAWDRATGR